MPRGVQGEGSVYQRAGDGRWVATVFLGYDPASGKRVRRAFYADSQHEAVRKRKTFLRDLEDGVATPKRPERLTVEQWMRYWLDHVIEPVREPTTLQGYRHSVSKHIVPYIGHVPLQTLQTEDVEGWLRKLRTAQVGVRSQQLALTRLRTALSEALRRRTQTGVRFNAAIHATMPRGPTRTVPPPSTDDARALLEAARGQRLEALIIVLLGLGLRRGEALGLRWEDIDWDTSTLTLRRRVSRVTGSGVVVREGTKMHAGKVYTVIMPRLVAEALRAHRGRQAMQRLPTGYVFTGKSGAVLHPEEAARFFRALRTRAGITGKTLHHLRHDSASLLLAQGVPLWAVSQVLHHSSSAITERFYAHITPEQLRDAADKMDQILGELTGEG